MRISYFQTVETSSDYFFLLSILRNTIGASFLCSPLKLFLTPPQWRGFCIQKSSLELAQATGDGMYMNKVYIWSNAHYAQLNYNIFLSDFQDKYINLLLF